MNQKLLKWLNPEQIEVDIIRVEESLGTGIEESELDEMWSYVGKKTNPRWLWHAIDHRSGKVLAYVFGRRKDKVFLQLKKLLLPFGIKRYCTDGWGAYERHLPVELHEIGKRKTSENRTEAFETKNKNQTASAENNLLFQDGRDARFSHWIVHQSL